MQTSRLWRIFGLESLCATLLVLVTLTMCVQVFTRYVLAAPFIWADEIVGLGFTWLTFLAAAVALKYRGHIAFTFFVDLFSGRARRVILSLIGSTVLLFLGLVVFTGARMALLVHDQLSAALELPMSVYYTALPVGAALMIGYELAHLVRLWRGSPA